MQERMTLYERRSRQGRVGLQSSREAMCIRYDLARTSQGLISRLPGEEGRYTRIQAGNGGSTRVSMLPCTHMEEYYLRGLPDTLSEGGRRKPTVNRRHRSIAPDLDRYTGDEDKGLRGKVEQVGGKNALAQFPFDA